MLEKIQVSNYIYGKRCKSHDIVDKPDIYGNPLFEVHVADKWDMTAAVECASRTQNKLKEIPLKKIVGVIKKSMKYYFEDEEKNKIVVNATGSSIKFVREAINVIRKWGTNFVPYVKKALPENIKYLPTMPVIVVLPSNSQLVAFYVLAQTLLSKNSVVVRPSSNGASGYIALEFVEAISKAIDELEDESLLPLKDAISIVNASSSDYLSHLAIDGWNYVLFGSDSTISDIKAQLREHGCEPKKVIDYGTGFSQTIIFKDAKLQRAIKSIVEAVSFNGGIECDSTDVIYVQEEVYNEVVDKLRKEAKNYNSGDPFENNSIGYMAPENISHIEGELFKKGKDKIRMGTKLGRDLLHTTIVPLGKFDSAMEYPGPIVSVRPFKDVNELGMIICKDLKDNDMKRNLITSIFTNSDKNFFKALDVVRAHTVKQNKPTHEFNIEIPHQGIYLLKELVEPIYLDR